MEQRKNALARLVLYLVYVAEGLTVTQLSPLVTEITNDFKLTDTQAGLINSMSYIGGAISIVLLIFLTRKFKKGWIFIVATALFCAMMYILGTTDTYFQLLVYILVLGIGRMIIDSVANSLLADRFTEGVTKYTNTLHMCFSIGAFVSPIIIAVIKSQVDMSWRDTYFMFAVISTVIFALFLAFWRDTGISDKAHQKELGAQSLGKTLFRDKAFWLSCIIILVYELHQIGVTYWTSAYFETKDIPLMVAQFSASALWIGIIVSRLISARLNRDDIIIPWVTFGSLVGGIFMTVAVAIDQPYFMIACYFIAGITTGAIIPSLIARVGKAFPAHTGVSATMICLFITIGSCIAPILMGGIADAVGMHTAMFMGGLPLLAIFVIAIIGFNKQAIPGKSKQ